MSFLARAPSSTWEAVPLPLSPPAALWAWFKPVASPDSVVLQLPPELWSTGADLAQLTVRNIAGAAGIESLIGWTLYGQHYQLDPITAGLVDVPLPAPVGVDGQLILWAPPAASLPLPMPAAAVMPRPLSVPTAGISDLVPGEDPGPYFDLIEFYWTNILYIESDVRRARAQLDASMSKLNSLNRDLTFDELYAADSSDKQHWQDVRRWLRDAASSLSRSTKEIDVGLLSSAGQRNRFLDLYERFVQPRIPFPGMKQVVTDFEMYHKSAKNVLQAAQTALNKGSSDGERRANAVLQRIHQKARQKSNKARGKNA